MPRLADWLRALKRYLETSGIGKTASGAWLGIAPHSGPGHLRSKQLIERQVELSAPFIHSLGPVRSPESSSKTTCPLSRAFPASSSKEVPSGNQTKGRLDRIGDERPSGLHFDEAKYKKCDWSQTDQRTNHTR